MAKPTDNCGCCEGLAALTPESIANRPGLAALNYRVGTHSSFLESMLARLSSHSLPDDGGHPLRDLGSRDRDDPSIALLDAWATVADVLSFYQERIANEGFLRTAERRRSVLELARLVGYRLRPGVAAGTWLALELEKDYRLQLKPHEVKAQSVPGPDETAQTFENIEPIEARAEWNRLQPRLTRPQTGASVLEGEGLTPARPRLWIKGITTDLRHDDAVLVTDNEVQLGLFHVDEVVKDTAAERTLVIFQEPAEGGVKEKFRFDPAAIDAAVEPWISEKAQQMHGVKDTETAKRVVLRVQEIRTLARRRFPRVESAELVFKGQMDVLRLERDNAETRDYEKLHPWLEGLVKTLEEATKPVVRAAKTGLGASTTTGIDSGFLSSGVIAGLTKAPSLAPRSPQSIDRNLQLTLANVDADTGLQLVGTLFPGIEANLDKALSAAPVTLPSTLRAYVFRATARPFGHNAAPRAVLQGSDSRYTSYHEWRMDDPLGTLAPGISGVVHYPLTHGEFTEGPTGKVEEVGLPVPPPRLDPQTLYLDGEYKLGRSGWVVVERADATRLFVDLADPACAVSQAGLTAYGVSGKSTLLKLPEQKPWLPEVGDDEVRMLTPARRTLVHCESEELELAEEPIAKSIATPTGEDWIELDGLYSGLEPGRWLAVSGERDDVVDTAVNGEQVALPGIEAAELVMLAGVEHRVGSVPPLKLIDSSVAQEIRPGEGIHTFIRLAEPLAYSYRRDSATINANLVKATHGESRDETLGAGAAAKAFQSFELKQTPVTYLSAPTPAGAESSLEVYVNDVRWHEADALTDLGPDERGFVTKSGDQGKTTVVFGNGRNGARLPTGLENVRARYRSGIGRDGNVRAGQISQLAARPLGLKGVVNPLRASGGADREERDTALRNAPHTVTALDRLVSVSDYGDFARTFAGIGKAVSALISDGRRQWVHLTIAGADDIPIDEASELFRNLRRALVDYGEPGRALALQVREALLLVIGARVRILPDYLWEKVHDAIREELLDRFSFAHRALGQDLSPSEVIAAIQAVEGVAWVDLDALGGLPEKRADRDARGRVVRRLLTPAELADEAAAFLKTAATDPGRLPPVRANLADFDTLKMTGLKSMRPAQLAYLSPRVPDTLVINQVKDA